jgi:ribosomal protein S18 acetylase RimI-like enzyme
VGLLHRPPLAPDHVVAQHPSHLHVDLLPRWQGGGWGRVLLERLFAQLAAAGSPGVHLGVGSANERAVRFYRRLGFEVLDDSVPGALFLGRRLP